MNNKIAPWFRSRGDETLPARGRMFSMPPLYVEMDKLFDNLFTSMGGAFSRNEGRAGEAMIRPSMDVCGDEKQYVVTVELPGVDEKDLTVELEGDTLRIKGEKRDEREVGNAEKNGDAGAGRQYFRIERSYGSFERLLSLPEDVEASGINAAHKDGVLTVTLPRKKEVQPQSRNIEISREK